MIKNIYSEGDKSITYAYNLTKNDYSILEEKLGMNEKKINDMTNEEIFTPRISKSDWEIYKLYYPEIKSNEKQNKFSWSEIYPLIVLKKENKIVIIDEKYFEEFYEFVEQYIELHGKNLDPDRFFLNILHRISQSLYKYVRFFIGEHDNIEILLKSMAVRRLNSWLLSLLRKELNV